jgi:NAD(P)-dependent dehydrogenase (short-subunit alcohol dehydrogenase family)
MTATRPLVVVTGAGTGIGASVASRLAPDHDLLLTHLQDDGDIAAVAERARRTGASVTTITGDLTEPDTITALRQETERADRPVHGLVSNAGAYPRVPWRDHDPATFARQIDVNLLTHAAVMHLLTPFLTAGGAGRIVAVSSVLTQLGRIDLAGYIAAKSGLEGLVRALARELGPAGVTVNCVRAGSIEVPAELDVVPDHPAMVERQLARQAIKRRGTPADIAGTVAFLLSDDAAFITGQCVTADGGWHLA